jgi:seryl-tRNA(Sec) selenium transferase
MSDAVGVVTGAVACLAVNDVVGAVMRFIAAVMAGTVRLVERLVVVEGTTAVVGFEALIAAV